MTAFYVLLIVLLVAMIGAIVSALIGSRQLLTIAILTGSASIMGMILLLIVDTMGRMVA